MNINFGALLATLGPGAAARIANSARVPGDYLFNSLLPEELKYSYHATAGTMTIRSTMAGLVGMDSPYPPGGAIDSSSFAEQTAKIANEVPLNEQTLRSLQEMMMQLALSSAPSNDVILRQLLNFLDKVIIQPHLDTAEWMRGKALTTGKLQWTFGQITLNVDYGVPVGNILTPRTGTDAYNSTTSKFLVDIAAGRRILKSVRAIIAHPETIDAIRYNTANNMATIAESDGSVTLRLVNATTNTFTADVRDVVTLISYDKEAEVLDPAAPGTTVKVPFMPVGKIIMVGNNATSGFAINVDQGSTQDANANNRLGYTHIAPTIEGGGVPGRWSNLFTPEHEPYKVIGRGVTNLLPVLEAPEKLVILESTVV